MEFHKHAKKAVAMTWIILFAMAFQCGPPIEYPEDPIGTAQLARTVQLLLKMNEPQMIHTSEGRISVHFRASELCVRKDCSGCDSNGSFEIYLTLKGDTVKAPQIRLYRCSQSLPITYPTMACNSQGVGSSDVSFTVYGNIMYSLNEWYPYPETHADASDFFYNNKYYARVTILSVCQ